jgi:cytoskeletal protein RodZ
MVFISEKRQRSFSRKFKLMVAAITVMVALLVVACSPSVNTSGTAGSDTNTAEGSSNVAWWSAEAECSSCHTVEATSLDDSSSQVSVGHSDSACTSCHTNIDGLEQAHEKVTPADTAGASKLKKTKVSPEDCLACHQADYTAEATASVTALTDKNGTTVNPHDLPADEDHKVIICGDCHTMHSTMTIEEAAYKRCVDCHHMEVFECGSCH